MKPNLKMYSTVFCMILLSFLNACKKTDAPVTLIPKANVPEIISTDQSGISLAVPKSAKIFDVGTGSGDLVIDGKSMNIEDNILVRIKGGTYNNLSIRNIKAPKGMTVFVKNNGKVKISESMTTNNISNVIIAGDNTTGLEYGFVFENLPYRAISMSGRINGITLMYMSFKNIPNNVIGGDNSNGYGFPHKSTEESRNQNFKILKCVFDNTGQISFGGTLNKDTGEDSGLFKTVEIAHNTFKNSNAGNLCYFSNVQDYNIHHNVVENVNKTNNEHNGIFFMQGNGSFHHNKLTNYQGNAIRMWLFSRGNAPAVNEIYNNICFNTRKYGAFELQAFDRNIYSGKSTFANAKIYNNTVGHMNTSQDWEGQILDLYNTKGSLEYYNNLGFELKSRSSITNMINNMSDTKITKIQSNVYKGKQADAVMDAQKFTSKINGIGAAPF